MNTFFADLLGIGESTSFHGSFEKGTGGSKFRSYSSAGKIALDAENQHEGRPSLRIESAGDDDCSARQRVTVKPDTWYRLSGFIKTRDVRVVAIDKNKAKDNVGPSLSNVAGFGRSDAVVGTHDWQRVTYVFKNGSNPDIELGPRLGMFGTLAQGTAWFADLTLEEIGPAKP